LTQYRHPMRDVVFHAYIRQDGAEAIARGKPYGLCPMFFEATTADEALRKAEAFRADAVETVERAYANRVKALAAGRLAMAKSRAESQNRAK